MRKRDRTPKTYTRLTHPLVRDSRDEPLRRATWEEALDRTARGLAAARGAFGMFSCARATNEMNYVAQKLARVVMGTHNVDSCNRTCHAPSVAGLSAAFGSGGGTSSYEEIEHTDVIVMWGSNARFAHPIFFQHVLKGIRGGARMYAVDPRRTSTAEWAEGWLGPNVGTDIPLAHAVGREIIHAGLANEAFISRATTGYDEYKALVEPWTLSLAEKVTGVPAAAIRELAHAYARAERAQLCGPSASPSTTTARTTSWRLHGPRVHDGGGGRAVRGRGGTAGPGERSQGRAVSSCLGLCERAPAALVIRAGDTPARPARGDTPARPAFEDEAVQAENRRSGSGSPGTGTGRGGGGESTLHTTAVCAPATPDGAGPSGHLPRNGPHRTGPPSRRPPVRRPHPHPPQAHRHRGPHLPRRLPRPRPATPHSATPSPSAPPASSARSPTPAWPAAAAPPSPPAASGRRRPPSPTTRTTWSATRTNPNRAPSRTASSWRATRTPWSRR
ncbi:Periplasmic nitrate reductase [Streptomyces violaceorubidus]